MENASPFKAVCWDIQGVFRDIKGDTTPMMENQMHSRWKIEWTIE